MNVVPPALATGGPLSCGLSDGALNGAPDLACALLDMGVFEDGREAAAIWFHDDDSEMSIRSQQASRYGLDVLPVEPLREAEAR